MIDIHSHLLYGIDDGAKTIEESIDIIKNLSTIGVSDIILTPHYIKDSNYNSPKKNNLKLLETLKKALKENKIKVNLYLGNEIYLDEDIYELLLKEEISSLNNTKYLLIELPMTGEYEGYIDIFKYLISKGYKVILAHPERYLSFQKDFNKVYELEKIGIYFQSNIESIIGSYGKGAKRVIKKLLKEKKISFIASDIHHRKKDYNKWDKAKKKIRKHLTEDELNKLLVTNPSKIIKGDII